MTLYFPDIARVRESMRQRSGYLSEIVRGGILAARAVLRAGGNDDLGPLSERQIRPWYWPLIYHRCGRARPR